jgi:hypothetical protein
MALTICFDLEYSNSVKKGGKNEENWLDFGFGNVFNGVFGFGDCDSGTGFKSVSDGKRFCGYC